MIPISVLAVVTGLTILLLSFIAGLIAGSQWLAVWVMGKLLQRELTKGKKK